MGKSLDDSIASLSHPSDFTSPSSTLKENYFQELPSNVQPFEMNENMKDEKTKRPAQKRSESGRSRRNHSLSRSTTHSDQEYNSPKKPFNKYRSHSSSPKEVKCAKNLDSDKKIGHILSNGDRLRFVTYF